MGTLKITKSTAACGSSLSIPKVLIPGNHQPNRGLSFLDDAVWMRYFQLATSINLSGYILSSSVMDRVSHGILFLRREISTSK